MSRFEIVIDEIILDGADVRHESVLREAIHAAVQRSIASTPITPRTAKSAVAERVATSVTSAVSSHGGKP
jgi:hypothetical protein